MWLPVGQCLTREGSTVRIAGMPDYTIDREQLREAIFVQNSLNPKDGIFMMRSGEVKCAQQDEPDVLCELISGSELGRMLAADALFSYTEKELAEWVNKVDTAPLQAKIEAAIASSPPSSPTNA